MEIAVFKQAFYDALRFRRLMPWVLLGLLCLLLSSIWGKLMPGTTKADHYITVVGLIVFRILALASAIFMTSIVSQEVEQKTIVYLLTRPVGRVRLLVCRYFANVLVVILLMVFATYLTSLGGYHSLNNPLIKKDLLAVVLGAMSYSALFLFISLILNRALVFSLLFAFGWESSIPNLPAGMHRVSILSHLQAVADHPDVPGNRLLEFASGATNAGRIGSGPAIITLLVFTVVLVAASAWWFNHFEYVPREDAE